MNDGMLLQINRQRNLIPEERLKAALSIQEEERASGRTPRSLLDILATRGDLDSTTVRLIRTLGHRGITDLQRPVRAADSEETVVEGFHAIVESVIQAPEAPPSVPSRTGWPKEVLEAETDLKNLFGQFVLVAQVGSGGSGTVYRAWDRRVSRYAGLKILHTMEPSALERFTREARIAGNLQHPCIATIYEVGEQDGRYYIAMKYIDGKPIDADPRSIPECLALIRDACRALDYAHKQGIIHRDVKPANLLVDSQDHVYVTDFGIAKQAAHEHTSTLSMTGTIIGTPKYLPPEQARGEAKRADARSDVYSIGATLYTLLAGRAPFPSSNVWETLESVMKREPPALTTLNAAVSPELERIVAKAMAKDPVNRHPSAGALADELDRILEQRRYTGRYGLIRYLARKWVAVAIVGLIVGILMNMYGGKLFFTVNDSAFTGTKTDPAVSYGIAAQGLLDKLRQKSPGGEPEKTWVDQIRKHVIGSFQPMINGDPKNLHYRVALARADHMTGDFRAAEEKLAAYKDKVDQRSEDYRIGFLEALMDLESFLDKNPAPLPEPEAPRDWEIRLPVLSEEQKLLWDGLPARFKIAAPSSPFLIREWDAFDSQAILGLQAFVTAKDSKEWNQAAVELSKVFSGSGSQLPVIRKALHRATYLARAWESLRHQHPTSISCRECLGMALYQAYYEPQSKISDLEDAARNCAGLSDTHLQVLAHLARRSVELGLDPADAVSAADKVKVAGDTELRAVLRAATTRWRAFSASDTPTDYEKIRLDLEQPKTWMGKLARIESLISQGARIRLRGGNPDPPLKQARDFVGQLEKAPQWIRPRVLLSEIYLNQGLYNDATKELSFSSSSAFDLRGFLVAAEAHLRSGRLGEARDLAQRVNSVITDHPEALCIWASALLEEAKSATDPSGLAVQAVDYLSIALERIPRFIEARFARATALFLVADWSGLPRQHAVESRLYAIQDLKVVLQQVEGLAPARTLLEHLETLNRENATGKGPTK